MCGISGKIILDPSRRVDPELVRRMNAPIRHRGPDGEGFFVDGHVGFGHRRLAIIDLTTGDQPISNEDGTVWVVFNGEIYNYRELRRELIARGHALRTQSDTEVIVHLYEDHGPACVQQLCGMFAFALYDRRRNLVLLARDRVGIKPLYYAQRDGCLWFASEVKSILADPAFKPGVDRRAIDRFLAFYYLPGTATLFDGVEKLAPGHILTAGGGKVRVEQYWDLEFPEQPTRASFEDSVAELDHLLKKVVSEHMISDVPVGALLSGGVDSTAVLSLAVEASDKPVSSFTIGFDGGGVVDERHYAELAAKRFGTAHYETTISSSCFRDFLPAYVWHMEEPVCEPPAVALNYVSRLAREHVKVVVSGEGGDEAFAGYSNYRNDCRVEALKKRLGGLAPLAGRIVLGLGAFGLRRFAPSASLMTRRLEDHYYSRSSSPHHALNRRRGSLLTPDLLAAVDREWSIGPVRELFSRVAGQPALHRMLYVDTKTWLPDDLLIKADKITMANSLELRVPLLDHRVLEFAAKLPASFKLDGAEGKRILKACFAPRVPRETIERKKAGFPIPYERWFASELRGYVRDLLLDRTAQERGYFRPRAVERLLRDVEQGRGSAKDVFALVVLELWHRVFIDRSISLFEVPEASGPRSALASARRGE